MNIKRNYIIEAVTNELKKSDIVNMLKHDKDFEKHIKSIIADVITDLFRVLYQHNGIYRTLAK